MLSARHEGWYHHLGACTVLQSGTRLVQQPESGTTIIAERVWRSCCWAGESLAAALACLLCCRGRCHQQPPVAQWLRLQGRGLHVCIYITKGGTREEHAMESIVGLAATSVQFLSGPSRGGGWSSHGTTSAAHPAAMSCRHHQQGSVPDVCVQQPVVCAGHKLDTPCCRTYVVLEVGWFSY
jgi:hypothetical protein